MIKIDTFSGEQTTDLGKRFAGALKERDLVILEGALGGGKTTFVKGIMEALKYKGRVLSPSFTLMRQYKAKELLVHHIDLYRLDEEGLFNLGLEDVFYSNGSIALVEWGDKLKQDLDKYIEIKFLFKAKNKRQITFSTKGYNNNIFEGLSDKL